ncbi:flavoprotein [Candidatus Palauibacter sp.]|uniref:flavoprotein n=1 Tax=Candidatus Palauibacter sp. TaxID=3101350 RepID=UPI003B02DAEF
MRVADLAIIGAGPTGLEAAAGAARAGVSAVVLEAGAVAQHVHTWRWVRLFSSFELNAGPAGLGLLRGRGVQLPAPEAILTGEEFRTRYLLPLAAAVRSSIEIREGARVLDVARADRLKGEALGSVARADRPFRLLVDENGADTDVFARAVFDCSGTWGQPGWAGPGGAPARGERAARRAIEYHLPDPLGAQRDRYAGRRTLLLGAGHSAATTAVALAALARAIPGTRFTWASRRVSDVPLRPIDEDPLPERAELTRRANAVAAGPPPGCAWLPAARLLAAKRTSGQGFDVELEVAGTVRHDHFDRIVASVGYEPDDRLYRQLQIHTCYASLGPMGVSAALLAARGDGPADCLIAEDALGPEALLSPEPGFFILGAKSFGKNSAFLMRTGYEQVADAFSLLDLRASPAARSASGG